MRSTRQGRLRVHTALTVVVTLVLSALSVPPGVAAQTDIDDTAVIHAARERATYGLRSDPVHVRELMHSGRDVGSRLWGIVLTRAEEEKLDLVGRMTFAAQAREKLLPYAHSLSSFAGAYVDQARGGLLVIQLTERDLGAEHMLDQLAPDPERVEIAFARHTLQELKTALGAAWTAWEISVGPASGVHTVSIDEELNAIVFGVAAPEDIAEVHRSSLESTLGVRVALQHAQPTSEALPKA